ncbi:TniQ family protein [Gordonia terrae]|nr:TniQ family protein [Gordonia terrae]
MARDRGEGVTIEQVAKDFGVHPMTLHKWMRRADIDEGRSPGVSATESAELREARKRIRHHFSGSRFCPRCLAEPDCIWQRQWAHPLLPICLRHRLRLQTRCPGCGQVPFSDTTWLGRHGPPWHCPQRCPRESADRKVRPFCRHDLRDATVIEANDDLCTAQRYLTALAEATDIDDPTSRYDRTAATTRFEAFCDLAADKVGIEALVTLGAHQERQQIR